MAGTSQNREPSTTENRLIQAQAIMPITTVMGRLVLLNRFMAISRKQWWNSNEPVAQRQ